VYVLLTHLFTWAVELGERCGGTMSPHTFGTSGVQGVQGGGPMKMIFPSTPDSLHSVLYK